MKNKLFVIERKSGKKVEEKIYGLFFLNLLYQRGIFGSLLLFPIAKFSLVSKIYGFLQKKPKSRKKILPFIQRFAIDPEEFAKEPKDFTSFNDFFIRKLKPASRPIALSDAVMPADGRYLFIENIQQADTFYVKGQKFDVGQFLNNRDLANRYAQGSMVIARLCPTDYHRFHFPIDAFAEKEQPIAGNYYSVNPIALSKKIQNFWENKRVLTTLVSEKFGLVLCVEVGATNVGTIVQTFTPGKFVHKGDEKGYFSFGGSSLILLFERGKIAFDQDLLVLSNKGLEIQAKMGESLGNAL